MVDVYEKNQSTVIRSKFILAGGVLQVQDDVIHVKVAWLRPLSDQALGQLFSLPDSIENSVKSPSPIFAVFAPESSTDYPTIWKRCDPPDPF
jgi:hypothetical protein